MKKLTELTPIQYEVTQNCGTERPFENEFFNHFEKGIYVDIISGDPLFLSEHKFNSQCGWPSFYKCIAPENIVKKEDMSLGMKRIEVRSKKSNSHLGHVFPDGPAPTGVRYCINSAALEFVALEDFDKHKLSDYKKHFEPDAASKIEEVEIDFATLGGGCFWGVEALLAKLPGVVSATSGYCGGKIIDPTYEQISTGKTGHAEVVQVKFNSIILSYEILLDRFFALHDPTTLNSQGYDIGTQYRSVIFYHSEKQKEIATAKIDSLNKQKKYKHQVVTEVTEFETFYAAEDYHQKYYEKKYQGGHGPICHFYRDE